ncbi:MAG: N-acetylmuramoyl-L-alanine amidase [Synechococcales cyanobacterium M58_A2018_015]|nr:N-acetylmuramoyl-L-alanine amidase [Synechococcales cyanobacterium M58_A2018_015]
MALKISAVRWWLPSLIGVLWLAAPAQAGRLETWHYDRSQNRLELITDEDVQPRAQLVFNPTRLVIDLPGTLLDQGPINELLGGAVQRVRIGQFDAQTTRVVVELAPGYTLDPQHIQFRGISPTQWQVQLPQPQLMPATASRSDATPESPATASENPAAPNPAAPTAPSRPATPPAPATSPASLVAASLTEINAVQVTESGLFINTEGGTPNLAANITTERSRDRRSVTVRIAQARLSPQFVERQRLIDRHGIREIRVSQASERPPVVEIELEVSRRSPDWQAAISELGGIDLLPKPESASNDRSTRSNRSTRSDRSTLAAQSILARRTSARSQSPQTQPTRAQSANSSNSASSERLPSTRAASAAPAAASPEEPASSAVAAAPVLPRRSSQSPPQEQLATIEGIELDPNGRQLLIQTDRPVSHQGRWQGGVYLLTLTPAQLAERVTGPQLMPTDPLRRLRLRQENEQTVVISIHPAAGVQFGALNLVTPQLLSLEMQRPAPTVSTPSRTPNQPLPNVTPNGRIVVVIDPGHGGGDPGAVGIGNIHEADVVLAISQQVASLLQQQGIQAVLTRNSDIEIDLEPRVQMAERANATLFVSIHANSMGMDRPDVNGVETYYYASGAELAQTIQDSIISSLGMTDRGIRQARFYVLRRTSMPAVLVETGFVTGSEDAPRLANASFQSQMATAIARGILQYLQQQALAGSH